jgi:DNA-binding response OmpR family regulator
MYEEWRVLHIDEDEEESRAFCRALEQNEYAGKCDTVRSMGEGRTWLEESLYMPRVRPRPDIVVLNWHAERDEEVMDFVRWLRAQPQYRDTPLAVWVGVETPMSIRETARSAGVTQLIHKATDFDELIDQTKEMLENCVSRCVAR